MLSGFQTHFQSPLRYPIEKKKRQIHDKPVQVLLSSIHVRNFFHCTVLGIGISFTLQHWVLTQHLTEFLGYIKRYTMRSHIHP